MELTKDNCKVENYKGYNIYSGEITSAGILGYLQVTLPEGVPVHKIAITILGGTALENMHP